MNADKARKILWLAARVAVAEFLSHMSEAEGNTGTAEWFDAKLLRLEGERPDPVDDPVGNHMFWELCDEWGRNLGTPGYGDN